MEQLMKNGQAIGTEQPGGQSMTTEQPEGQSMATEQSKELTKLAIAALEDKKAEDIKVIYISGV